MGVGDVQRLHFVVVMLDGSKEQFVESLIKKYDEPQPEKAAKQRTENTYFAELNQ